MLTAIAQPSIIHRFSKKANIAPRLLEEDSRLASTAINIPNKRKKRGKKTDKTEEETDNENGDIPPVPLEADSSLDSNTITKTSKRRKRKQNETDDESGMLLSLQSCLYILHSPLLIYL
jgi:hypothetical protein